MFQLDYSYTFSVSVVFNEFSTLLKILTLIKNSSGAGGKVCLGSVGRIFMTL